MKFDKKKQKQFTDDIYAHDGKSLVKLDCQNIQSRKKVIISERSTYKFIKEYFKSRCDFKILSKKNSNTDDFDFKWTAIRNHQNFKNFNPQQQIINHIQNLQKTISDKDKLVRTLKKFDEQKIYNFTSDDFHFQSYIINLNSQNYTQEEQYFMQQVNSGIWMTKDPNGSLGKGIELFKDLNLLKDKIQQIKNDNSQTQNNKNSVKKEKKNKKTCFIQKYLENPLILDNKKVDFRGYVLIASLNPLVVLYQDGYARKCIEDYDTNFEVFNQTEAFKHLSNRTFQKNHTDYQDLQEELSLTPEKFENLLKQQFNLDDNQLAQLKHDRKKIIAYCIMAAENKLIKQNGTYQMMAVDLMWDENFNTKLIEFNTNPGLSKELTTYQQLIPQIVQSTLDLIIETFSEPSQIYKKWKQPKKLELGRWEIIINEANNYNILDQYKRKQNDVDINQYSEL
ncbi:hypothetical protein PPERSA_07215 [Pseudocohnilembus persalinus]|uniref:Tubulin-tyrosine ligase/Tubulin polyglutamylase n=1 Tax=Pseudocohnilembus persalinus TaxID=266149 RepID=A0A0V0QD55_PSEPJ|nr:hypothetical protein PPERSA_07215 [Pseudocohnilembus persalinus]|eukprot:KRX00108.1 hypothetical protein PPERSA_07215 [Pseudocohnilembus persalinus]